MEVSGIGKGNSKLVLNLSGFNFNPLILKEAAPAWRADLGPETYILQEPAFSKVIPSTIIRDESKQSCRSRASILSDDRILSRVSRVG